MTQYYAVAFDEHQSPLYVFYRWNHRKNPPRTLREEYAQLRCPKCALFDPREAIQLGISDEVKIPKPLRSRDVIFTADWRVVVSTKSREVLESVSGLEAEFYPLPGDPTYFIMLPVKKFVLAEQVVVKGRSLRDVLRADEPPCPECHRYPFTMISVHAVQLQSTDPWGAIVLDGGPLQGSRDNWFGTDEVVQAVRKAKLKGWIFRKLPGLEPV